METLEEYMQEQHTIGYMGLDDDMPDSFDAWIGSMDASEMQEHAEEWGKKIVALDRATRDRDLREALYALGLMWNQYCGTRGHLCMSAGESASEVLEQHGLLASEYSEADWDKLDALLAESK